MNFKLNINGEVREVDVDPETPLLWVLRDAVQLNGTKYGCGIAQCGACTVHIDGQPTRACVLPVKLAKNREIITIEGIDGPEAQAVQEAWVDAQVPQCGYCQSGQVMSAVALLRAKPQPTDGDIDAAMTGNICRCATYTRIRKAIHKAAEARSTQAALNKETQQ